MGKYNNTGSGSSDRRPYLGAGSHTVTITNAEILTGDEARPPWVDKSVKFTMSNDEGIVYWDCELAPWTLKSGEENSKGLEVTMQSLENMGFDGDVDSATDFDREVTEFVLSGRPIGTVVEINIVERPSTNINPNTNKPYINRNVYVNRFVEEGVVGTTEAAEPVGQVF